jgi:putative dimethyl sulfoxide reductase chaperone
MGRKPVVSGAAGAGIAAGRAAFYDLLVAVFRHLPDRDLLMRIERGEFQEFFARCCELGNGRLDSGVDLLNSYQGSIRGRAEGEVLTELSVDRTKMLRGTGHEDLKPPYEGLYTRKQSMGDSVLEARRSYRKAGLMPDETVHESPDYLCVELDFMKQLCLREQNQWCQNGRVKETITQEEEFLREHLGTWVGDFCRAVGKHGLTDFYKGFSLILDAFVSMDKEWLGEVLQHVS